MIYGLVNIVTPGYNCANYIHRLMESILVQTYSNIKMWFIDDGSTDDTKNVVVSYISKFEEKGYELIYLYQKNAGQSAALNAALKLVDGEYLVWPDSDDWFASSNVIESMVEALANSNDAVNMVRGLYNYIDELDFSIIKTTNYGDSVSSMNIFEDAIYRTNDFMFTPGGYMIKTKNLAKYIPNNEIFVSRYTGQNAQILFPYLAYGECITLCDVCVNYLVRATSHSHGVSNSYEKKRKQYHAHMENFVYTLSRIRNSPIIKDISFYVNEVKIHFFKAMLASDDETGMTMNYMKDFFALCRLNVHFSKKQYIKTIWYGLLTIKGKRKVAKLIRK